MSQGPVSGWRRIVPWLKWPAAIAIIAYLVAQNRSEFRKLFERPIEWQFLAIGCGLCSVSIVLTFVRWYLLVWAQQLRCTFWDTVRLGLLGYIWNYITPGAIGGDLVKIALLVHKERERRLAAASTVVLDRMLGLISLLVVGAAASFFAPTNIEDRDLILKVIWGGMAIGLSLLAYLLHPVSSDSRFVRWLCRLPKVGHVITDLAMSAAMYQTRRKVMMIGLAIGMVGQLGVISSFYFCARALGDPTQIPSYITHIMLIPLAELVSVVVPTPGGLGALEAAVQQSYRIAGANPALGLLAAGAYRLTTVGIAILGGVYYALERRQISAALEEEAHEASATGSEAN